MRIFCGGTLYATFAGIARTGTGSFVDVARIAWPGCVGTSVMASSTIALVQPTYYSAPLHCAIACTRTADCTAGEVCGAAGSCVLD